MDPATHPDPFTQAVGHAAQRSAQLASIVMAAAQVYARYRARRQHEQAAGDEQAARVARDERRASHQRSRLAWAPALDRRWLGQADLLQTARVWAAAAPFADADPAAASALRACEQRLRRLHPYAMARYDRLHGDGHHPIDAMRDTVPLFTRHPHARPGDPATQRATLPVSRGPGNAGAPSAPSDSPPPGPSGPAGDPAQRRGLQIIQRLQDRARAAGRAELGPGDLAVVLEATTNLPSDVITRLTAGTSPAPGGRTAADVAAESFPFTAAQTVAAIVTTGPRPAATAAQVPRQRPARHPGAPQ